jgi:adenosylhomocysteine nucleosidase
MIGIIGAMDKELHLYFQNLTIEATDVIGDKTFYIGHIHDHKVVVVKSGIGKVNAAITTSILLSKYNCRLVINTGIAGGLQPMQIGDILLAKGIAYFDVSLTEIDDLPYGKMADDPLIVEMDTFYVDMAKKVFESLDYPYKEGNLVSGDKFVTSKKDIRKILRNVSNVMGVEMEGMAIALTCHKFNIPFVSVRGVSDIIDSKHQTDDYNEASTAVAEKTTQFVMKFLEAFNE